MTPVNIACSDAARIATDPAPTVACEGKCLRGVLGTPDLDPIVDEWAIEWGDLMLGVYLTCLAYPSPVAPPFLMSTYYKLYHHLRIEELSS